MNDKYKNKAQSMFDLLRSQINGDHLNKIINEAGNIISLLDKVPVLGKYISAVPSMISMIKSFVNGSYRAVPFTSIAAIAAALIYLLNPIDVIPDFIPLVGFIDDAFVLDLCMRMINKDLEAYRRWKESANNYD